MTATMLVALMTPGIIPAQDAESSQALRAEWSEAQANRDRKARQQWWEQLTAERLQAFIDAKADIGVTDRRGWTALHSAARYSSDPVVVSLLIAANADVDAKDRSGDTPLHWAAADNDNVEIVNALIEAGADVNTADRFGWLPIHTAADRSANPQVIEALLAAGSKRKRRAYFLLFSPRFLLKHNSNMSDADKEALMPLLKKGK